MQLLWRIFTPIFFITRKIRVGAINKVAIYANLSAPKTESLNKTSEKEINDKQRQLWCCCYYTGLSDAVELGIFVKPARAGRRTGLWEVLQKAEGQPQMQPMWPPLTLSCTPSRPQALKKDEMSSNKALSRKGTETGGL